MLVTLSEKMCSCRSVLQCIVLLWPSSFHRHRGGCLPWNHIHHRGVVQYSRRSFWCCFLKTAVTIPQSSYRVSKCRIIWSHTASPRHCPTSPSSFPPARPLPHLQTTRQLPFSVASQTAFVCTFTHSPILVIIQPLSDSSIWYDP